MSVCALGDQVLRVYLTVLLTIVSRHSASDPADTFSSDCKSILRPVEHILVHAPYDQCFGFILVRAYRT